MSLFSTLKNEQYDRCSAKRYNVSRFAIPSFAGILLRKTGHWHVGKQTHQLTPLLRHSDAAANAAMKSK